MKTLKFTCIKICSLFLLSTCFLQAQTTTLTSSNVIWPWHHVGWDLRFVPSIDYRGQDFITLDLKQLPNSVAVTPIHEKSIGAANYSSNGELLTPEITFDGTTLDPQVNKLPYWENENPNANDMMKAELLETYNIQLNVNGSGDGEYWYGSGWFPIPYNINLKIVYQDKDGFPVEIVNMDTTWIRTTPLINVIQLTPPSGSVIGYIHATISHKGFPPSDFQNQAMWQIYQGIYAPFWVEGVVNEEVPILHTAPLPEIPELVLEAPPGDHSQLTFTNTNKTCREISNAVTDEFGNNTTVGVSLGFEGSVGLIATVDIEATVEISGGVEISQAKTSTTTSERCVSLTSGFTLPPANELGEDRSIFLGYGGVRRFGEFRRVAIVGNKPAILDAGLTYYDEYNTFPFKYTTSDIEDEIDTLTTTMDNAALPDSARTDAMNQIDVWNQVLANHTNNVANAPILDTKTIQNSIDEFVEEEITVSQVESIDIDFSTGGNLGIAGAVEVAGTGVNGSTEFYMSQTRSQGSTNMTEESKVLAYTLSDDDDDVLVIEIRRNEVYGTPIFILDEAMSKTSCPYEGGYRRDQPSLTVDDTCSGEPVNDIQFATDVGVDFINIDLNICNESNEDRSYSVRAVENPNNATVTLKGSQLGNNNFVTYDDVPPGSCLAPRILTVEKNIGNDQAFIKLVIYPTCFDSNNFLDEVEELIVNVTFGEESGLMDNDCDGTPNNADLCPDNLDSALDFDKEGTPDYVSVPHHPDFNLTDGDFAFEAWVNPSTPQTIKNIVSKGSGNVGNSAYLFAVWSTSRRLALYLDGANESGQWKLSNTGIPLNEWTHVAVSVDQSGTSPVATFYINGVVDATSTYAMSSLYGGDTNPFFIGVQGWEVQGNAFDGMIDEVAVWNKTLSEAEIAASMTAPYAGTESGLVAYYDFNDASACVPNSTNTTLIDKANSHNGVLTNFTLGPNCSSNWTSGQNIIACAPNLCPPVLDLSGTQSTNIEYESGDYISSDQTILSPAEVEYDAATSIDLLENFEVRLGAIFHAYIDGCGSTLRQSSESLD